MFEHELAPTRVPALLTLLCVIMSACATPSPIAHMTLLPATSVARSEPTRSSPIVELRQYTLHKGRRDDLIRMFDAAFVEPQEAAGIKVIGQFRNLDDPNKFVWLRGFSDMETRKQGLTTFYTGPEWRSRRTAANETIIDNDNVLLLRPVRPDAAFDLDGLQRQPIGSTTPVHGFIVATVYHLDPTPEKESDFVKFFGETIAPVLQSAGAPVIASFVSEQSANTFPGLPVREREHVFVWFSRFKDVGGYDHFLSSLASTPVWRDSLAVELSSRVREPFTLRLSPTERSLLH
ncbi:MAG: NIPSNAP family protein [Gemmatimonadaceae bacterium]